MAGDDLVVHLLDMLAPLGGVTAKRMFGAHCLLRDGAAFAIVDDGRLFFKVDDSTRPTFEAAGGQPFTYEKKAGGVAVMSYFTIPDDAVDDRHELLRWARLATQVAAAVAAKKAAKASKATTKKTSTKKASAPAKKTTTKKKA